eukprot:CAMPEP_0183736014 /NCGR_PEP_ID=MMETSP0737-20130205/48241_1 /TAXON_ID=385413 /ORGANISM="Thalassiosira miniscula, Strain CCMP1093" /LENGTH=337 /DNA_ID=CAMNT_0025969913 /DNA_START=32 /DNA_END=1045 /DNA_ORIENTATION=+
MRVQVSLRAEKLGNIAPGRWRGKKSNPYAVVSLVSSSDHDVGDDGELGRTGVLYNNLNPSWTKIFTLDHDTSQSWTPLRITLHDSRTEPPPNQHASVYHRQLSSSGVIGVDLIARGAIQTMKSVRLPKSLRGEVNSDPIMGKVDVEVGDILKMDGQELKVELEQGGNLYVHITESIQSPPNSMAEYTTGTFDCHIRGLDLQNIEWGLFGLGAIDPYFELSKKYVHPQSGIQRWTVVYRSEHIPNIINPYWQPFRLDLETFCHGNLDCELKITVLDYERTSKDRWLGENVVTPALLMQCMEIPHGNACRTDAISILNNEDPDNVKEIGLIVVLKAEIR